jgi:hypothetical protein
LFTAQKRNCRGKYFSAYSAISAVQDFGLESPGIP